MFDSLTEWYLTSVVAVHHFWTLPELFLLTSRSLFLRRLRRSAVANVATGALVISPGITPDLGLEFENVAGASTTGEDKWLSWTFPLVERLLWRGATVYWKQQKRFQSDREWNIKFFEAIRDVFTLRNRLNLLSSSWPQLLLLNSVEEANYIYFFRGLNTWRGWESTLL